MTDLSRDIQQRVADGVTAVALPGNVALWYWLDQLDHLLRVGIGVGTFILVWWAVYVKIKGKRS